LAVFSASGWTNNILWVNNGSGVQVAGTLYSISSTSETNLCNGGTLCFSGATNNCP